MYQTAASNAKMEKSKRGVFISVLKNVFLGPADLKPDSSKNAIVEYSGFLFLLKVHRALGISYFGASLSSQPASIYVILCSTAFHMILLTLSFFSTFLAITHPSGVYSTLLDNVIFESDITLRPLIRYLRLSSIGTYHVISYALTVYLATIARPVFRLIETEVHPMIDPKAERTIGRKVILCQLSLVVVYSTLFQLLYYLKCSHFVPSVFLETIVNFSAISAPIALIGYINACLSAAMREIAEKDLIERYIQRLIVVGNLMSRLTALLSPAIILLITSSMLVTISCACLLVTDYSATFYVSLTGFTAFFTLFLVLILVSSYTHETCKATSALFRRKMAVSCCFGASGSRQATVLNADGHQVEVDKGSCPNLQQQQQMIASQLMIMSSLESEVRMAPFGLFYLIPAYIMRFFAVMLSYSVILIQTSDQSVHPSDRCNASHF